MPSISVSSPKSETSSQKMTRYLVLSQTWRILNKSLSWCNTPRASVAAPRRRAMKGRAVSRTRSASSKVRGASRTTWSSRRPRVFSIALSRVLSSYSAFSPLFFMHISLLLGMMSMEDPSTKRKVTSPISILDTLTWLRVLLKAFSWLTWW
jgi:hypothetical protein